MTEHYDYTVFDSPPVISIADTEVLSSVVDEVVLVVRRVKSACKSARRAKYELMVVDANITRVVLSSLGLRYE